MVSDQLSQKLAASIAFLNAKKFKDVIWSKLPSVTGGSPSLLLAYCKEDWGLPIIPLITGDSEVEDFDDYLNAADSVIKSFSGNNLSLDVSVDFTEIVVVDKANRKINFSTTANIEQLIQASEQWGLACNNSPDFKLDAYSAPF